MIKDQKCWICCFYSVIVCCFFANHGHNIALGLVNASVSPRLAAELQGIEASRSSASHHKKDFYHPIAGWFVRRIAMEDAGGVAAENGENMYAGDRFVPTRSGLNHMIPLMSSPTSARDAPPYGEASWALCLGRRPISLLARPRFSPFCPSGLCCHIQQPPQVGATGHPQPAAAGAARICVFRSADVAWTGIPLGGSQGVRAAPPDSLLVPVPVSCLLRCLLLLLLLLLLLSPYPSVHADHQLPSLSSTPILSYRSPLEGTAGPAAESPFATSPIGPGGGGLGEEGLLFPGTKRPMRKIPRVPFKARKRERRGEGAGGWGLGLEDRPPSRSSIFSLPACLALPCMPCPACLAAALPALQLPCLCSGFFWTLPALMQPSLVIAKGSRQRDRERRAKEGTGCPSAREHLRLRTSSAVS